VEKISAEVKFRWSRFVLKMRLFAVVPSFNAPSKEELKNSLDYINYLYSDPCLNVILLKSTY
jgi:hypothetical protein